MKRVAIVFADGFEEVELVSVIDILRRATVSVEMLSVGDVNVTGAHGITMLADEVFDYYSALDFDAIIFAGGMKNAETLAASSDVIKLINYYYEKDKLICGICATPAVVFSKTDILKGREFTCYPDKSLIEKVEGGIFVDEGVVFSNNVITSQSPLTAIHFALAICEILGYDSNVILNELEGV